MSETNWGSKTFWGFAVAFLVGGLQTTGFVGAENFLAELIQWLSATVGVWGARDAVRG